jgi:hypothetical protein
MPFGEYKNFKDCVDKNQDKEDPEAYCAKIQKQIEGSQYMDDDKLDVTASMPIVVTASDEDDNTFTIAAAKVGSKSFGATGTKYNFTKESLQAYAKSWEGGIITLNHERLDDGVIKASWFDEHTDLVMMTIACDNPETARRMRAGEATGVSIEASLLDVTDDNDVVAFDGTGVSVIFYPEQPACPLKDGCGILASKQFEAKMVTASEKRRENIHAKDYDLARRNDAGDLVKIDSVWTWDDDSDAQIEQQIANFVSFYGAGEYKLTGRTDTKIGDTVGDDDSAITVSIDINKPIGGTIVAKDVETVPKTEHDEVLAKNAEMQSKLDALEADETLKAKDAEIETLTAGNKELTDELNRRDDVKANELIEEIKAWDAEFAPTDGMKLVTVETIHASLKRAFEAKIEEDVTASKKEEEVEEDVTASNFTAPAAAKKSDGLTIGGWVGGEFVQNV